MGSTLKPSNAHFDNEMPILKLSHIIRELSWNVSSPVHAEIVSNKKRNINIFIVQLKKKFKKNYARKGIIGFRFTSSFILY